MSNYIEPEMEKIKLEEENLDDVSGGVCIGIKKEENDDKYCTKIKTEDQVCSKIKTKGNDPDNIIIITGEGKSECTIKCENERIGCSIV